MTNEEILNAISEMSVLELSELVKAIEDKFGVSRSEEHTSELQSH